MGPSPTIIYGRMCAIHLLEQWIVTKNAPIYRCHRLMRYSSGAKMQNPKPVNSWPRCQQGLGLFCRLRQQPSFFCVVCKKKAENEASPKECVRGARNSRVRCCEFFALVCGDGRPQWSFEAESAANSVSSRAWAASLQSQCNFATVENIMWNYRQSILLI